MIRLERLAVRDEPDRGQPVSIALEVRQDRQVIETVHEVVDSPRWQAFRMIRPIPGTRWPRSVVIGLLPPTVGPVDPAVALHQDSSPPVNWSAIQDRLWTRFRSQVSALLSARNILAVSRDRADQAAVTEELRYQHSGRVRDDAVVAVGRELGATVLLRTRMGGMSPLMLTVDLLSVESGAVLATIPPVEASPGDAELLADAVAGRLEHLFEEVPPELTATRRN